jgi:hypothetical protein
MNNIVLSPDNVMGALAGAIVAVGTWAVSQFGHVDVPAPIAAALTTIVYFIVCHFVPTNAAPETAAAKPAA